jgi:hypothetical protein
MNADIIRSFIARCDNEGVTPVERHIDAFLDIVKMQHLRCVFIKFCFYCWEDRHTATIDDLLVNILNKET